MSVPYPTHFFLYCFFFFNDTATTEIYTSIDTLSLHDALPISTTGRWERPIARRRDGACPPPPARRSEEHTSELQSPIDISYAVFCLQKKKTLNTTTYNINSYSTKKKKK